MQTLVRTTALTRRFGRHLALSGVDLSLKRGQVLGLLGLNGAGKTTCLRLLSGVLAPTSGYLSILGIDLARRPWDAKRYLGYLPERPPLYPELRVDEYLTFCARLRRIPPARIPVAVVTARRRCGLEDHGRQLIAQLSKGFRQRLGIAQAILHGPDLLILDEPTEGLDPLQVRELRKLIRALASDCGIILSTHLLPEVQAVCDRVAILHQGRIRYDGRIDLRPETRGWRVRLERATDPAVLAGLPGVAEAIASGLPPDDGIRDAPMVSGVDYRIRLRPGVSAADLARAAVRAELPLCALGPEPTDLERIFFDLTGALEGGE